MKIVLQRVIKAHVTINKQIVGTISQGLVLFLGITQTDNKQAIIKLCNKIINLRIFPDNNHKMNNSLNDIKGSILIISQFTLYGQCVSGNRPSFTNAAGPIYAKKIYNEFVNYMKNQTNINIQTGQFGAMMKVTLINDGPVTFILDTNE